MDILEAIHTQRAVRRFKPDPVPQDAITQVIDSAIRAPSGGNRQLWSFVVIQNPTLRSQIGLLYKAAWDAGDISRFTHDTNPDIARVYQSAQYLAERMGEAPVLIIPCVETGRRGPSFTTGASIYPAVQNLMLSARALGLGTVITTIHLGREKEIKELVGIPENVATAALVPMGYPESDKAFGPGRRRAASEVTYVDRWG